VDVRESAWSRSQIDNAAVLRSRRCDLDETRNNQSGGERSSLDNDECLPGFAHIDGISLILDMKFCYESRKSIALLCELIVKKRYEGRA
jgi:hypothetical protein